MSNKKFEAFLVPESSVYQMQPGEYEIQSQSSSLEGDGGVEVQAGYGEVLGDRLLINEPSDVWLPEGTTLFPVLPKVMSWLKRPVKKPFQIAITPKSGYRTTNFRVSVFGTKGNRKVLIKVSKKGWGRINDPILATTTGEGKTVFTGDELARDMKLKPGTHTMYIYGQEKSWGIDRYTKSVPISITVRGSAAAAADNTFRLAARPTKGSTNDRFLFLIYNARSGREVWIRVSKPGWGRVNDPIIAKTKGRGIGTSTPVYVSGSVIAKKTGNPPGSINDIMVYADEKYLGKDRYSASIPIRFKTIAPTAVHEAGEFMIKVTPTIGRLPTTFTIQVMNTPKGTREVRLCTSKPGYGRANDPVFARLMGDGFKTVTGGTLLYKRELDPTTQNVVYVYARADIPWRTDKYTPSVPVTLLPEPSVTPTACREGYRRGKATCPDGSLIYREVCRGGIWVPSGETCPAEETEPTPVVAPSAPSAPSKPTPPSGVCREGTYSADGKMICRGGSFVPVKTPGKEKEFFTTDEAFERVKAGLPCYVKSTLPLLNMLPGVPYIEWLPLPPFCVIQAKP